MNKSLLIAAVAIIVIVVLFLFFQNRPATFEGELEQQLQGTEEQSSDSVVDPESNTVDSNSSADTTDALEEDLGEIDLGDLETDFSDIDADLDSL